MGSTPKFEVKYSKSKNGPIQVAKFMTKPEAFAHLQDLKKQGFLGFVSVDGKPVQEGMLPTVKNRKLGYGEKTVLFRDLKVGDKFGIVDRGWVMPGEKTKIGPRSHRDDAGAKWGISEKEVVLPVIRNNVDDAYSPAEYPSAGRRNGIYSPYTTVAPNGTVSNHSRKRGDKGVTHKPLGRNRPRLKEAQATDPLDILRKIVDEKTNAKIHNIRVDLFSASAMIQVYDNLNTKNQLGFQKALATPAGLKKMADFSMRQMK